MDVGNTETVVGVFGDVDDDSSSIGRASGERGLAYHWRTSTISSRTPDEHVLMLSQLLTLVGLDVSRDVSALAISSSAPTVTTQLRRMTQRWFADRPVTILGPGVKTGMAILYDNPREVGADRIADAVGAYDLYPGPLIVVDLGTATVFDVVSVKGEYLGGAIAPGVMVSLDALYAQASGLRSVELTAPHSVIGRSTAESIQSGVLYGYAGQVDAMVDRIRAEIGPATAIATGGIAGLIAPHTRTIEHVEPWLTLHGLRIVHERHHAGGLP